MTEHWLDIFGVVHHVTNVFTQQDATFGYLTCTADSDDVNIDGPMVTVSSAVTCLTCIAKMETAVDA